MKHPRLIAMALALVVAVAAVSVALAGNGKHAKKSQAVVTHSTVAKAKALSVKKAATETPDPGETAGTEATTAETDGVDAGGNHQCPPDCAPGEQP